ncbi:MAG: hypothetical protein ABH872_00600 [Candidatus Omnitrophota bacterium]
MRVKKAQSILEYIIVLSAIIVAVIAAANGPIRNAINQMFTDSSEVMTTQTATFLNNAGRNPDGDNINQQ